MAMLRLKRFLLSRKTVIVLICAVGISCVIGSAVPQVARKPPQFFETWKAQSPKVYYVVNALQLNQVYTSIWFLVLVALIACSLTYSIYYQSKKLVTSGRPAKRNITQSSFGNYYAFKSVSSSDFSPGKLAREIKRIFKARGYRPCLVPEGSRYFIFGKNRWGRWGSVIFHVAMLLIIVAGLCRVAFHKRGLIQLLQTDTFQGRDEDWHVKRLGVFAREFNLGFQVRLNEFAPAYWENDQVKDLVSRLTIINDKGEVKEFSVSPGNPIHVKGTRISQTLYYGYCLGFMLQKGGWHAPVLTDFCLDTPARKDEPFVGKMDFPATDYILDMAFYPNLVEPSFYATLPGVDLTIMEKDEERFKGRVLFGQRVRLDKATMTFAEFQYWTQLVFAKNYGMPFVYGGFVLGTLGAVLMFMFPYKEVVPWGQC